MGIRHPDDSNKVISTISISDKAVATSGDYERFFMKNGIRYNIYLIWSPWSPQACTEA
ncbi:MAG: FAD:protein FMN transferase [Geovibrio sp.]|nr:FAD:protein FMN transferase [Geovibrio sp.]